MVVPRLRIDETALVVIDVQERLIPTIVRAERLVKHCAILLRLADELKLPYLVTEQYPKGLGRTVDEVAGVMPDPSRRIEKTRFSAAVDLVVSQLRRWRRSSVLVAGIEAHVCVLQTVLDLQEAGWQSFVVSDAVSASQADQVAPALARMRQAGAIETGVISAMYELMGDSTHASFRRCLELAKAVQP